VHCVKVVEDVVVKKLTFAISSPDEFLVCHRPVALPRTRLRELTTLPGLLIVEVYPLSIPLVPANAFLNLDVEAKYGA